MLTCTYFHPPSHSVSFGWFISLFTFKVIIDVYDPIGTSLVAQRNLRVCLPMQETQVQSLGWEDPLDALCIWKLLRVNVKSSHHKKINVTVWWWWILNLLGDHKPERKTPIQYQFSSVAQSCPTPILTHIYGIYNRIT